MDRAIFLAILFHIIRLARLLVATIQHDDLIAVGFTFVRTEYRKSQFVVGLPFAFAIIDHRFATR